MKKTNPITQTIAAHADYFIAIRQAIHANPELGFSEVHTAKLVAQELKKMGLEVLEQVGDIGVVAIVDSGKSGKTVALRAELDALPIREKTNLPYQSKQVGKMHACGHDGHTATLLTVAKALSYHKDDFKGKVKFIFQPAEEKAPYGAPALIQSGVLTDPPVDAIFAFHNHPGIAAGRVLTRFGSVLSSNTQFSMTISGKGGHPATPEHNVDPILIGAMLVQSCLVLNQQLSFPDHPLTVRVTEFNSGVSKNVVPDIALLAGTIRATTLSQREEVKQRLESMAIQIANAQGGTIETVFEDFLPPTVNSEWETAHVLNTARRLWGEEKVQIKPLPARASEDFAFYLEKLPGCYFFIGNGENTPSCHSAYYDFNDAILPLAAELLCHVAMNYLNN